MKKQKSKKEKIKVKLNEYLTVSVLCFLVSIFLFAILISAFGLSKVITYEDAEYKEYKFEKVKKVSWRSMDEYWVYVSEENDPLVIEDVVVSNALYDELQTLESGDSIYCYVKSDKILEIGRNGDVFLSLDEYNKQNKEANLIRIIVIPFVIASTVAVGIVFLVKYKKLKKDYKE